MKLMTNLGIEENTPQSPTSTGASTGLANLQMWMTILLAVCLAFSTILKLPLNLFSPF